MIPTGAQTGFTLIELVITVAIIGLLASAAFPLASMAIQREKESELRAALREIRSAIDAYKEAADQGRVTMEADKSGYPADSSAVRGRRGRQPTRQGHDLLHAPPAARSVLSRRHRGSRRHLGPAQLRQPAGDPQPGDDVFDVYSLSTARA